MRLRWIELKSRHRMMSPALFVTAFAIRVGAVWILPSQGTFEPLGPDYREYRFLAHNLVEHNRFGFGPDWQNDPVLAKSGWRYFYDTDGYSMFRTPGYPFLLACLERTVGPGTRALQIFLALVDSVTVVLLYRLGTRVFGFWGGLATGLLSLFNPGMLYCLTKLGREPVLGFLFVLGLTFLIRTQQTRRIGFGMLTGVCFGLAAYFKETVTIAGFLAGLWLLYHGYRRQRPLARAACAMLLCMILPLVPWICRNGVLKGRFAFSNRAGQTMYQGLVAPEWLRTQPLEVRARLDPWQACSPADVDRRLKAQVKAYASDDPIGVLRAMGRNIGLFWSPVPRHVWTHGRFGFPEVVALTYYFTCFALAAGGFWVYRRREESWLAWVVLLGMTAMHSLTASWPRYRLPFDTILVPFAGGFVQALVRGRPAGALANDGPGDPDLVPPKDDQLESPGAPPANR